MKTTSPFRYDLNQIPYDYTVDVTNRFKELDLIYRVPEELWTEVHNIVSGGGDQNHPQENESESRSVVSDSLGHHGLLHGILQAKILEWVAFPYSRGSSQHKNLAQAFRIIGGFFNN